MAQLVTHGERQAGPGQTARAGILTNHTKRGLPCWMERVTALPGWEAKLASRGGSVDGMGLWSGIRWGWKLFRASRGCEAVVTGADAPALVFMLLQSVTGRARPHVVIHTNWNLPAAWWRRVLKTGLIRAALRRVSRLVVYSEAQRQRYARDFGISADQMTVIPFHTTLDVAASPSAGDYIFAGGDFTRDYRSLVEAVRRLPVRVIIAARFRHYFRGLRMPDNVEVVTVTHQRFVELMAGARMVIVPLRAGLQHSGGQQTFLNAMALGKPVVVADDCGAAEYIGHGRDGLIVPPGDAAALEAAIRQILEDPQLARRMGEKARCQAARYSPERFCAKVFDLLQELAVERST